MIRNKLFFLPAFILLALVSLAKADEVITGTVTALGEFNTLYPIGEQERRFENMSSTDYGTTARITGNQIIFGQSGVEYLILSLDNEGNVINWLLSGFADEYNPEAYYKASNWSWIEYDLGNHGGPRDQGGDVFAGDDDRGKIDTWGYLYQKDPDSIDCNFYCNHENRYEYNFNYETLESSGEWSSLNTSSVNKCQDIRLVFSPQAEWLASLSHNCSLTTSEWAIIATIDLATPPTPLTTCPDQQSCLAQATEYELTPTTWGRGIQRTPDSFVETTNQSLNGNDEYMDCSNGICTTYSSGSYTAAAAAPKNTYYGQCRGAAISEDVDGNTITTPEVTIDTGAATIPAAISTLNFDVINQPPTAEVSFNQGEIDISEEATATCNVVDPDCTNDLAHQDHMVKYKWNCYDSQYQSVDCHMKGIDDVWRDTEYVSEGDFGNPASQTVGFKVDELGGYIITCEAWDNDPRNPLSSRDSDPNGKVAEATIGVIPATAKFCTIFSKSGGNSQTACDSTASTEYSAYYLSTMNPAKFEWKCDNGESAYTEGGEAKECEYGTEGSYTPALRITDNDGTVIDCNSNASFKLTKDETCTIEARKEGDDNWSTSLNVSTTDTVEARVNKQCMEGDTSWSVSNGTEQSSDDDILKAVFQRGEGSISAVAGEVDCGTVNITTSETVRWGM